MILEGNNYDIDTLLVYLQDGVITAQQLIEHANAGMEGEYRSFIEKRGFDDTEVNARKFLDWWMDEDRDFEEEDFLEAETPEEEDGEEVYFPWLNDEQTMKQMKNGPDSLTVCYWRLRNPMSKDKDECAKDTSLAREAVEKWWQLPRYIEEKLQRRLTLPDGFAERDIQNLLLNI